MIQTPAAGSRNSILLALMATVLVWSLIGVALWANSRPAEAGSALLLALPVVSDGLSWRFLLLATGVGLTLLVVRAYRSLFDRDRRSEARIALQRLIVDHTAEAIFVTDGAQRILSTNAAFLRITGYAADEVIGRTPTMLSAGFHGVAKHRAVWDFVAAQGYWEGEIWDRRKDGSLYPKQMRITAICEEDGTVSHFVAAFTDVSEARAQAERIDYLAHHDPLTNLPNRLALDAHLQRVLEGAVPGIDRVALLIIDLDNFKTVNDSLGHPAGDRLLADVARRLGALAGKGRRLFRLGGDEFAVVIERMAGDDEAVDLVHRLVGVLGEPCEIEGHQLHSTPSVGISVYPEGGRDAQALIRNADTAMYHAKAGGRNSYRFFAEPMSAAVNKRLHLESELWRALAENQLVLHYQPQIDLMSGRVVGIEALVRWHHPVHGLIPPAEFIPVAEACGLILPLGHWVLRTACRQVRQWLDTGLDMGEIAINISAHQFRQPGFAQSVQALLAESGLPAEKLELEITESTLMHGVDAAIQTFAQLKAMGIRLAIDDFGTGYSSLAYLRRFPIDRLKIDRSFLADVETNRDAAALLRSIVMLGRSLGLQLVAEGVENFAQADFLRSLACERVQGYHFYQPVTADEVASRFRGLAANPA